MFSGKNNTVGINDRMRRLPRAYCNCRVHNGSLTVRLFVHSYHSGRTESRLPSLLLNGWCFRGKRILRKLAWILAVNLTRELAQLICLDYGNRLDLVNQCIRGWVFRARADLASHYKIQ